MDLEKKTFLIILATLTVVAGLAAVVADRLVLESFRDLEKADAEDDLQRARLALGSEVEGLDRVAQDWAHRDDTHAFVQDGDPAFEARHLVPTSFAANGLAVMVLLDTVGQPVFAAGYDPGSASLTPPPPRFQFPRADDVLLAHPDERTSVSGLIGADGHIYIASSWPILTSAGDGPSVGTLIWARWLDDGDLSNQTRLDLALLTAGPAEVARLADGPGLTGSRSSLLAETLVLDVEGDPAWVLRATLDRAIYRQGLNTMAYVFASAILMGGGLLVAMIALLNTTVLSRLTRLTHRVEALGEDPHGRVEVSGSDEITRLSAEFNRLLDRLDRHQSRLADSNADLRHFAAVVSRDLQPPLSTIALNAAILREHNRGALDDETMERLARMESTALRMASHIRSILDYSRVSYEAANLETVDLDATLKEVAGHLEERLRATKGRLETSPLPAVEANATQMVQLLQNLVANGLKYHRPGVPPVVKVSGRTLDDGRVRITVEDNGEGFDAADFDRMRKPYIRLPGRGHEGHGLGLATADKIVERHHGRLWAESVPGQGSRFHVDLPQKQ